MKSPSKNHKPYPGLKGHFKTYVNHSLKSFEKYLNVSKLSNWQKDQLMMTHILLIDFLKDTFKKDPLEMNCVLMDNRSCKMKQVKMSNLKNDPYHYSGDEDHDLEEFEDYS